MRGRGNESSGQGGRERERGKEEGGKREKRVRGEGGGEKKIEFNGNMLAVQIPAAPVVCDLNTM